MDSAGSVNTDVYSDCGFALWIRKFWPGSYPSIIGVDVGPRFLASKCHYCGQLTGKKFCPGCYPSVISVDVGGWVGGWVGGGGAV